MRGRYACVVVSWGLIRMGVMEVEARSSWVILCVCLAVCLLVVEYLQGP